MDSMNLMKLLACCLLLCSLFFGHAVSQRLPLPHVREKDTDDQTAVLQRDKRGVISILVNIGSGVSRIISGSVVLANALTDGCATQPSICTNKQKIETYEGQIKTLTAQYDALYIENKKEFIKFREASVDNAYIEYYFNETMMAVENISDIERLLYDKIEVNLTALHKMWEASKNKSSAEYIKTMLGTLEYTLADIDNMLSDMKRNALIGLAVEYAVLGAVTGFMNSYKKSYNQLETVETEDIMGSALWSALFTSDPSDAAVILDPEHPRFEEVMNKYGASDDMAESFKTKFKRGGRAFKTMFSNARNYFKNVKVGIQKWTKIRSWKGFKGKFVHSIQKPVNKLKSLKSFVTSKQRVKNYVKGTKLSWSQGISAGIGLFADALTVAIDAQQWAQVAKQMSDLEEKYRQYRDNLTDTLQDIRNEKVIMEQGWANLTEVFVELVKPLREILQNSSNYNKMYSSLSGTNIGIDTSSPLFSIDLSTVNKGNIREKQGIVIGFVRDNNYQMQVLQDKFKAKFILYDKTENMTESSAPVQAILDRMKDIYAYSPSKTMVAFGVSLKKSDIVCLIAALDKLRATYDFFQLDKFRPACDISQSEFTRYEEMARERRKLRIMYATIDRKLSSNEGDDLDKLLLLIQTSYRAQTDPKLQELANTVNKKDILCYIASQYKLKSEYDFYDLAEFRPNCDKVTDAKFNELLQKAQTRRSLLDKVKNILNFCSQFNMCPCVSQIAMTQGASEEDVKAVIRSVWQKPRYCDAAETCCFTL